MGQWNITIRGTGAHHNADYPKDANKMAAKFVQDLKDAGHIVDEASITYGGADVLAEPYSVKCMRERLAAEDAQKEPG
jgi:hypothetical protein